LTSGDYYARLVIEIESLERDTMILDAFNKPNKLSWDILDSVVSHAIDNLELDTGVIKELNIIFKGANGDNCGYFDGLEDEDDGIAAIEINSKKSVDVIITTIFHELVHVQQVLTGAFDDVAKTWHGETYANVDYDNLPWEIDAFDKEAALYASWKA